MDKGKSNDPIKGELRHRRTRFVIRSAAVFFLISAIFEVFSTDAAIPLGGAMRGGGVAFVYHTVYALIYLVMATGLWISGPWAFRAVLAGTIIYSIEKVIYLFDGSARSEELRQSLEGYEIILDTILQSSNAWMLNLPMVISILAWWGFVGYLYLKRDYFTATITSNVSVDKNAPNRK